MKTLIEFLCVVAMVTFVGWLCGDLDTKPHAHQYIDK